MRAVELYLVLSAVYLAPQMTTWIGIGTGSYFLVLGILAALGERR